MSVSFNPDTFVAKPHRARFKPRPDELRKIAQALGVSVETLTTDESKILAAIEGGSASCLSK